MRQVNILRCRLTYMAIWRSFALSIFSKTSLGRRLSRDLDLDRIRQTRFLPRERSCDRDLKRFQGSYTFQIVEFEAFQGFSRLFQSYFTEEFKVSDKKHKNYHSTAPPSGSVRSSRDRGCMMQYLRGATFTGATFMHFGKICTRFHRRCCNYAY